MGGLHRAPRLRWWSRQALRHRSPHLLYSPRVLTSYATGEKAVYSSLEGGLATDGGTCPDGSGGRLAETNALIDSGRPSSKFRRTRSAYVSCVRPHDR